MRAALIDDEGLVVNLIEYDPDGDWVAPPDHSVVWEDLDDAVDIGHRRQQDGSFSPPEPPAADPASTRLEELRSKQRDGTDVTQAEAMEAVRLALALGRI